MKKKYLLPCSCGEKLLVDVGQAGQRLACKCGRTVEAPTMRAIGRLAPAPDAETPPASGASGWSLQHGVVFAAGLLAVAVALATAGALLLRRNQLDTTDRFPNEGELLDSRIEGLTIDQSWDLWQLFLHGGVGVHSPSAYILDRRHYQRLTWYLVLALLIAAAGGAAAAGALLLRPRARAKAPP